MSMHAANPHSHAQKFGDSRGLVNVPAYTKIAISGDLGSGKSTVASDLAARLGMRFVSTGGIQRELAQRKGLTTLELNRLAETDPSIDREIDAINCEMGASPEPLIIDARMAWKFVPHALKVFLAVDEVLGAERIFASSSRSAENPYTTVEATLQSNRARRASELVRFKDKYGVDISDWTHFDLVVNTSGAEVADIVDLLEGLAKAPLQSTVARYFVSPCACFPWKDQAEASVGAPVQLAYWRGANYVWSGAKQVDQAITDSAPFLEANIVNDSDGQLPDGSVLPYALQLSWSAARVQAWASRLRIAPYRVPIASEHTS